MGERVTAPCGRVAACVCVFRVLLLAIARVNVSLGRSRCGRKSSACRLRAEPRATACTLGRRLAWADCGATRTSAAASDSRRRCRLRERATSCGSKRGCVTIHAYIS